MFFTAVGKILAYLGFGFGVLRVGLGFQIASQSPDMEANVAAAREYLAAANTGEAINEGFTYILVSVALGILCEISRNCGASKLA